MSSSCARCKHHKIRCDRKVPCTNCARMKKKVICEYKPSGRNNQSVDLTPHTPRLEEEEPSTVEPTTATIPQILQAIPEARLLHAENMLTLSRNLFMNRSPDLPSPWPHWSAYASEQVPEPSIMRTAFNDLRTLAVSVTKRLMQVAITQAISRLRSQRRRTKKGVLPFVKTRDVLSAIDILGLKRNGRSHWVGVARRCNVHVFDEQRTTRFKRKQRGMTWDQAEQILGLYDVVAEPPMSEAGSPEATALPDNGDAFKRRAARSGTPLPMDDLSLSNTGSDIEETEREEENDSDSSDDMDEQPGTSTGHGAAIQSTARKVQSLEQFDQEATRQEEEALCNLLGFASPVKRKSPSDDRSDDDFEKMEHLTTSVDDWRNWTDYHAPWEEYEDPISDAKFTSRMPHDLASVVHLVADSDALSSAPGSPQQARPKSVGVVELRAQNPQVYAAMRSDAFDVDTDELRSDVSNSDGNLDADVPTQSIENTEVGQDTKPQDAMDWES